MKLISFLPPRRTTARLLDGKGMQVLATVVCSVSLSVGLFADAVHAGPAQSRWAVLLCKYADTATQEPLPVSYVQGLMNGTFSIFSAGAVQYQPGLHDYWRDMSYGTLDFASTISTQWYTMPINSTAASPVAGENTRHWRIRQCGETAANQGFRFTNYAGLLAIFNVSSESGANGDGVLFPGSAQQSQSLHFVALDVAGLSLTRAAHETGHGLGLSHSRSDQATSCDSNNPQYPGEYCDRWDTMSAMLVDSFQGSFKDDTRPIGSSWAPAGPGLSAPKRMDLGWLGANIAYATGVSGETFTISSLGQMPSPGDQPKVIYIPSTAAVPDYYTVELRTPDGWDQGMEELGLPSPAEVVIHKVSHDPVSLRIGQLAILQRANGHLGLKAGERWQAPTEALSVYVRSIEGGEADIILNGGQPPAAAPQNCFPSTASCSGEVTFSCPFNTGIEMEVLQRVDNGNWHDVSSSGPLTDGPHFGVTATYRVCSRNAGGDACTAPVTVTFSPATDCGAGGGGGSGAGGSGHKNVYQ